MNNERIKEIYATYEKAVDDMSCILKALVDKDACYFPQYDEPINSFDKLSHKANRYKAYFPKPKTWYEKDLYLRITLIGEMLCHYYLQQEDDIDVREPFLLRVKALHKELLGYVPYIRSKKHLLWNGFINLNFILHHEFDKIEEYDEASKYYRYIVKFGPYGTDDNTHHWVELAMLEEYNWLQTHKKSFVSKKTVLYHIEKTEKILSVQKSLFRRIKKKTNKAACNWVETEILWILEGLAQLAELHNLRVSYLYRLWNICKKDETLRDSVKNNIAGLLSEIPHNI